MRKNTKNQEGITLIALIITIIILVILAAITIRAVVGMGIMGHAINGTQEFVRGAKDENRVLDNVGNFIDNAISELNDIQGKNEEVLLEEGLYIDGILVKSWNKLKEDGNLHLENGILYAFIVDDLIINLENEKIMIVIPKEVNALYGEVFEDFHNLEKVIFNGNIDIIGEDAFSECEAEEIIINGNVNKIEEYGIAWCENLKTLIIKGEVKNINATFIRDNPNLKDIYINGRKLNIITIAENSYQYNNEITEVSLEGDIIIIERNAYEMCNNLNRVTIKGDYISIDENCFYGCSNLTNVTLEGYSKESCNINIGYKAFESSSGTINIKAMVTSVDEIGYVKQNTKLEVIIPDGTTEIGNYAFSSGWNCLTKITIPESVTSIGERCIL